jgi:hypothetical protein
MTLLDRLAAIGFGYASIRLLPGHGESELINQAIDVSG